MPAVEYRPVVTASCRACGAALALLLSAGCAGGIVLPSGDDAALAARVKGRLIEADDIDAAALRVVSRDGVVTLSGFVETAAQRRRAETLARDAPGLRELRNRIEVKTPDA